MVGSQLAHQRQLCIYTSFQDLLAGIPARPLLHVLVELTFRKVSVFYLVVPWNWIATVDVVVFCNGGGNWVLTTYKSQRDRRVSFLEYEVVAPEVGHSVG